MSPKRPFGFLSWVLGAALVLAILSLPSCKLLCGNAEGYCGNKPPSDASPGGQGQDAPDPSMLPSYGLGLDAAKIRQLVGRTYYRFEPAYQCFPPNSTVPVKSFKNSIQFQESRIALLGDACAPTSIVLSPSELTYSSQWDLLGYKEGIYEYRAFYPVITADLVLVDAWCYRGAFQSDLSITRGPALIQSSMYHVSGERKLLRSISVGRSDLGVVRIYDGEKFRLRIELDRPTGYQYTGLIETEIQNQIIKETVNCSIVP